VLAVPVGGCRTVPGGVTLPQPSPNIRPIPGTSTRAHLRTSFSAAGLQLPEDALARPDAIAG